MEKTYKLLDYTEPMPIAEIKKLYEGYWVFMVNVTFDKEVKGKIINAIPVVIGKTPFDGVEDGIFEKFKTDEYKQRADMNLLPNVGFISALR